MCFKRSIIYVFTELSLKICCSGVVTFNGSLYSIITNDILLQLLFQYNIIIIMDCYLYNYYHYNNLCIRCTIVNELSILSIHVQEYLQVICYSEID